MVAFSSDRRAIDCAMAVERAFESRPDGERVRVRIEPHTGEAVKEGDDFLGRNVTLAARIASRARGGEILVSSLVKTLTESAGDLRFAQARSVELKGLSGEHAVYAVDWTAPA